ncbi:MAG: hypothetical protein KQH63_15680 [Desulfobulbaceae bacterium]|nr:hypothetical protein [Desulfobulbaceae bacterium]
MKNIVAGIIFFIPLILFLSGLQAKQSDDKSEAEPSSTVVVSEEEYSEKVKELMRFLAGSSDSFVYKRMGRSDPFLPFVSEKIVTSDFIAPERELVGMQKFEPGQLSLVAIVFGADGPLAMVQDSVGKGYILRNGTDVGRSGVVDEISENLVVIKQRYTTSAGEERFKIVEMLLKKEGEQ